MSDITNLPPKQPADANTARHVAEALLTTGCVMFAANHSEPFTLTSGERSPVYVDCRRLISYPAERTTVMRYARLHLYQTLDIENEIDYIAGGETAGIPYAAWLAEALEKPMVYVRKKAKGFGRMAQIEGHFPENESPNVLLVEDMSTDGGSKVVFAQTLRDAGTHINHIFCPFFYDIFPHSDDLLSKAHLSLHYLTTWSDILNIVEEQELFAKEDIESVKSFLDDPEAWRASFKG